MVKLVTTDSVNKSVAFGEWNQDLSAPQAGTFSVSGTLNDRDTITITALSARFGTIAPELLVAVDGKNTPVGTRTTLGDIAGVADITGDLLVESVPELPYGKGLVVGDDLNGAANLNGRIDAIHPTLKEGRTYYEHVVYYWPMAHQINAQPYLDGSAIWQIKTLWERFGALNVSDEFKFHNSFGIWFNPSLYFTGSQVFCSGLVGSSWYPFDNAQDTNNDPKDSFMRADIMSQQTSVKVDEVNGKIKTYLRNQAQDTAAYSEFNGQLAVINPPTPHQGPTRAFIPGYVRGFGTNVNAHVYYADVFISWGVGRVEVTDNVLYGASKALAIFEIKTYSPTEITAEIRKGLFDGISLTGKFLHITAELPDGEELYIGVTQL